MSVLTSLLDLLLPRRCVACSAVLDAQHVFCPACEASLMHLAAACPRCAEPGAGVCSCCRRTPPPFASTTAVYLYGGQLAVALLRLKYARAGHLARPLGQLLAPAIHAARRADPEILVVPVPLHPRRLRERGYNQSALLAREAGARLSCQALRRLRPTSPQAGLDRQQRRQNLEGSFRADPRVRGRSVLLIDDVLTTGATARACGEALLEEGAASVAVLVLARAGS